ncbi:MAG TPA: CoA transferase [Alphaproteobacteria bacterium]
MPESTPPPGPLSGVTVLDLTRVLAGPYCTMVLSDLGARVIKVEPPAGDDARAYGPWLDGRSTYFMSLNRGKESVALDLKDDADRALFERLLARADVLVENFRPGTMAKLGYGWEALQARHPRLIYAACSGFGHTGPLARRPAYDLVVQGMGGIMSLTGHDGGPPTRVGTAIGDIAAGMFTAIGVNAALFDRARTGRGQFIDIAMLDCQLAILENAIARYFTTGETPGPSGARHPAIAPFECYRSGDGHIILAAGNETLFRRLCAALGVPELADDPRFRTNPERMSHVEALKAALEAVLARGTTAQWLEKLEAAGVPCGPLNSVDMAVSQPQAQARNMVVSLDDPRAGPLRIAGNPIKLSAYPDPATRGPVPELGEHRARIERELDEG